MKSARFSPAIILSASGIVIIILFIAVAASGYRGFLPGSFYYKNKNENGFYVFYRLLEELDYKVVFESRYKIPRRNKGSVVYVDINNPEEDFQEGMLDWVSKGGNLVLFDNSVNSFFTEEAVRFCKTEESAGKNEETTDAEKILKKAFLEKLQRFEILYENSEGAVIVKSYSGKGSILLISDRSIFSNNKLKNSENARLLDRIFYEYKDDPLYLREKGSKVVFDPSLLKGLLKGKLAALTTHLALIFILFVIINAKRFSRPQNLSAVKIRKISEHIKAVGMFYQRAGASEIIEKTDTEYFKYVICKNRKPAALSSDEYDKCIEKITGLDEEYIMKRFKTRNKYINKIRGNK